MPAQVLRLAGVEVFAVGVQNAVESELREMANSVDSFTTLQDVIPDLVAGLCSAVTESGGAPVALVAEGNEIGPVSLPY